MKKKRVILIAVIVFLVVLVHGIIGTNFYPVLLLNTTVSKAMDDKKLVFKHDFDDWTYAIVEDENGVCDKAYLHRQHIFNRDFYAAYEMSKNIYDIESFCYYEYKGYAYNLQMSDGTIELYNDQMPEVEYFKYNDVDYVFMYVKLDSTQ